MPATRLRALPALALAAALVAAPLPATATSRPSPTPTPTTPTFTDVSVHDPSLVVAGDELYVFGSHLAAAKTTDLMHWEEVANGANADNPLFDDVRAELAETFDWAQTDTLWAADVIQLADGRFYMYYDACKGDSPRSAMGVAVADDVEGPYRDLGIILRSGMTDEPSENGDTYDAWTDPNVVDPDVFFDAKGKLWMVYGSYSGGIFILKMDPKTGKPVAGQGYGKHLTGGNHARIEGPTIMYDKQTRYYYLFLSFGGLTADGGYNMRVVRSKNPDGPYVDAAGNDMSKVKADASLPLFDDASIEPYGVKLFGNYQFERQVGDPGTGIGVGYVSSGHNTFYTDPKTGQRFLIFHTRFPGQGETHQVRVHEMEMNAAGWPVVSPYRYAGQPTTAKVQPTITREEVVGDYAFVDHGKAITADIVKATTVRLERTGRVTGAISGWWLRTGADSLLITSGRSVYTGALMRQWDPTSAAWVVVFTVQSCQGVSLWGSKVAPMTDAAAVAAVVADLSLGDTSSVVADLTLPTVGTHSAVISWASSDEAAISSAGVVTRPAAGSGDATLTLTATITKGSKKATKVFAVTVPQEREGGLIGAWSFDGSLDEATGALAAGTVTGAKADTTGGTVSYVDGVHGQAVRLDGSSGVRLPDGLITGTQYSVSLWLRPEALTQYTTAFFGARDVNSWVSLVPRGHDGVGQSTMLWSGSAWYDAGTGTQIPVGEWSHLAFTVHDGDVTVYVDGVQKFTGTGFPDVFTTTNGVFALGVNWWDAPFLGSIDDLAVYSSVLTPEQVAALATA